MAKRQTLAKIRSQRAQPGLPEALGNACRKVQGEHHCLIVFQMNLDKSTRN